MNINRTDVYVVSVALVRALALTACTKDTPIDASPEMTTGDDSSGGDQSGGDDDHTTSPTPTGNRGGGKLDGGTLDAGNLNGGKVEVGNADAGKVDASKGNVGKVDAGKPVASTTADGGSSTVSGGTTGDGGRGAAVTSPEPSVVAGCGSAKLYQVDDEDTGRLGPWPVGVKTLKVPVDSGALTVEVWYPAAYASNAGKTKEAYDLRDWLPTGAAMVPDSMNRLDVCECYRDLPLDSTHGPYPVMLYIHGLGSMRVASLTTMALWASRGFIVVAADHPGDMLTDFLASFGALEGCSSPTPAGGDMASEANSVLAAFKAKQAGFDFFGDRADLTRLALGGHSQGGGTVAGMAGTPGVKVIITLAPLGGGALNAPVDSMLQVTGTIDSVTGYSTAAYTSDRSPVRRHVGINQAGHLDMTDLCKEKNSDGKTAIDVLRDQSICGALILSTLAQCGGDAAATEVAPLIVNYATTAALEETLHCQNRDAAFRALQTKYPHASEFLHTP